MVRGHDAAPAGVCGVGQLKLLGPGRRLAHSALGSSPGKMHAASAALPAFAFQALTASERGRPMGAGRRGDHRRAVAAMAMARCVRYRGTGAR